MSDEERRARERRFKAEGDVVAEVAVLRDRLSAANPCAPCEGSGEIDGGWRCRHCAGFGSVERARQAFLAHCAYQPAQLSTNLVTHPRGLFTKRTLDGFADGDPEEYLELTYMETMRNAIYRLGDWIKHMTIWGEPMSARVALMASILRPPAQKDIPLSIMGLPADMFAERDKMFVEIARDGLAWCNEPTEKHRRAWGAWGTTGAVPPWLPVPHLRMSPSVDNATGMQPHVTAAEAASHWPLISYSPGLTWLTTTRLADPLRAAAITWAKEAFRLTIPENNPRNPGCAHERLDVGAPT